MDNKYSGILKDIDDGLKTNIDEVERFLNSNLWSDLKTSLIIRERLLLTEFSAAKESNEMFHIQGAVNEIKNLMDLPNVILNALKLDEQNRKDDKNEG